ncbi:MAG: hypothetical protein C4522_18805 [Desulfobacteraceae bacterium]|nr:MAG: hypothetical protein C4522_18805 [Desulfobacteraceae bacterium]
MIKEKDGSIAFVVVIILSVLTILGICGSGISRMELLISRNEAGYQNDFYISEGGVSREAQEIGNGAYPVRDIHVSRILATDKASDLPGPSPHEVDGNPYSFSITYSGVSIPDKGFSAIAFNRYDYEIDVRKHETRITSVYGRVGPKPDL